MKIVNKVKFIRMLIVLILVLISSFFIFSNKSYSKGEIKEKVIYISSGDTLWKIAQDEKESNAYYEEKDIREIIYEIKETNNIENNSNLKVGQKIVLKSI